MAMASLLGKSSASNGAMLTNNKRASIVDRYDQAKALGKFLLPIFLRWNLFETEVDGLGKAGHGGNLAFFNHPKAELEVFNLAFGIHFVGSRFLCLAFAVSVVYASRHVSFHLRDFFLSDWRSFLLFVVLYSLLRLLSIFGRGELEDPAVFMALCALGELLLLFVFLGYKWQKYSYKTLTWMSISFVLAGIVTGNLGGRIGIPTVSYIGVSVSFVILGGIAILSMFFRVLRQVFIGESSKESSDS